MPSKLHPHPEERPKGASRRTQGRYAALRLNSCLASHSVPLCNLGDQPLDLLDARGSSTRSICGGSVGQSTMCPACGVTQGTETKGGSVWRRITVYVLVRL